MSEQKLRVFVVDDDFMIAKMHGKLVDAVPGFAWIGSAYNCEQALAGIEEFQPDLIVLDVYLPDRSGIELLRTLRAQNLKCDVILITAAKEMATVEEGFRLGVFDYLIKPFDLKQLKETLEKYAQFQTKLAAAKEVDQSMVNNLKKLRSLAPASAPEHLQKGIDLRTLEMIKRCLEQRREFLSAEQISALAGLSRSTVRNYLVYLVEEGVAEEVQQYGTVGRPQRLFRLL
jgi:response regulator of citrate/malate metabolism